VTFLLAQFFPSSSEITFMQLDLISKIREQHELCIKPFHLFAPLLPFNFINTPNTSGKLYAKCKMKVPSASPCLFCSTKLITKLALKLIGSGVLEIISDNVVFPWHRNRIPRCFCFTSTNSFSTY